MKTSNTSRIDEDYIQNDSKCIFTTTPRIDKIQENDITRDPRDNELHNI